MTLPTRSLPTIEDRVNLFLRENGLEGRYDWYDCPKPHDTLLFYVVGCSAPVSVTVSTWQAWNDSHGWGEM
jgi:hypothetical protein